MELRAVVKWADGVNKKVMRNGTSWGEVVGFIEDTSLSGKVQRRFAHHMGKKQFKVAMRFTPAEYIIFTEWYKDVLLLGFNEFTFPMIDNVGDAVEKTYRMVSAPSYQNQNQDYIEVIMSWEQV